MKLVRDWRHVWRYFSVQAMALTATLQGGWAALPDDLKTSIPDTWINVFSVALLVLGVVGRFVVQVEAKDVE